MASNELVINIDGDPSGANQALDSVSSNTKSLEQNLASVAKVSGIAFAGLSAAIAGTVSAFREQEQAENQLNAVIESTGSAAGLTATQVKDLASSLQDVTTFGDEAILSSSNLLLTFKEVGEDTFPRAQRAILDVSQAMGQGLRESTIQVGKALNDPVQGLTALRRVGIQFTADQEELIRNFVELGDVSSAQGIILDELESQFGGSAEAARQGLGAITGLQNAFGDLAEEVGRVFAPVISNVANILSEFAVRLRDNEGLVRTLAISLGVGAAGTGLIFAFSTLGLAITKLPPLLAATNVALIGSTTAVRGLVGATGLGALLIVIPLVIQNFEILRDFATGPLFAAITFVIEIIDGLLEKFRALGRAVVEITRGNFRQAVRETRTALRTLPEIAFDAAKAASDAFIEGQEIGLAAQRQITQERLNIQTSGDRRQVEAARQGAQEQVQVADEKVGDLVNVEETKTDQLVGIESDLADQLIAIDQALASEQVDTFAAASDALVSEAQDRARRLADAESERGSSSSRSEGTGRRVVGTDDPLRELLDNPERFVFGPRGFSRRIGPGGFLFQQGFSGFTGRDRIPARISPGEIVVPETFSEGIRQGRFALTGAGSGNGQTVRVEIDLKRNVADFLTVQQNEQDRLGTSRKVT